MLKPVELVPRQFVGQARALRDRFAQTDRATFGAMESIVRPLRRRLDRSSKLAPLQAAEAAQAWREQVPAFGRIGLETCSSRASLRVREMRLASSTLWRNEWNSEDGEPVLALILIGLEIRRRELEFDHFFIATIGLHAIARRFQRGFDNSFDALTEDFRVLAKVSNSITDTLDKFEVIAGDGVWAGDVVTIPERGRQTRILSVRTFLSH